VRASSSAHDRATGGGTVQEGDRPYIFPATTAGALALAAFAVFLVAVVTLGVADVDTSIGDLNVRGAINFLLAIAAGALALYAFLLRGDRALLLLIPIAVTLLAIGFEVGERVLG
jgi:hypothetical protein